MINASTHTDADVRPMVYVGRLTDQVESIVVTRLRSVGYRNAFFVRRSYG